MRFTERISGYHEGPQITGGFYRNHVATGIFTDVRILLGVWFTAACFIGATDKKSYYYYKINGRTIGDGLKEVK